MKNKTIIEVIDYLEEFTDLSKRSKQIIITFVKLSYLNGKSDAFVEAIEIQNEK